MLLLRNLLRNSYTIRAVSATSNIQPDDLYRNLSVEVRGHDTAVLDSYSKFVEMSTAELGISLIGISSAPPIYERYTILKSAFSKKKHRRQYETRTYFRQYDIEKITGSTADTFLEYIQRNLPEGVAMKVTRTRLEQLPEQVKASEKVIAFTPSSIIDEALATPPPSSAPLHPGLFVATSAPLPATEVPETAEVDDDSDDEGILQPLRIDNDGQAADMLAASGFTQAPTDSYYPTDERSDSDAEN